MLCMNNNYEQTVNQKEIKISVKQKKKTKKIKSRKRVEKLKSHYYPNEF